LKAYNLMPPKNCLGDDWDAYVDEIELVRGASHEFNLEAY